MWLRHPSDILEDIYIYIYNNIDRYIRYRRRIFIAWAVQDIQVNQIIRIIRAKLENANEDNRRRNYHKNKRVKTLKLTAQVMSH